MTEDEFRNGTTDTQDVDKVLDQLFALVRKELDGALETYGNSGGGHPGFASAHEGYAVIAEELDELWDLVKGHGTGYSKDALKEAMQVAAMGVRYMLMVYFMNTAPPR
ncbi:hypothetical protein [uncultured Rhodospira sp.]|uniref:hypothetical protein n=1 Tax=uncultured Rhodospira sp. TaxID=1936189 RepID=UPI002626B40E|nr:hypothetical protein [uncultured Rhodospira sp.]